MTENGKTQTAPEEIAAKTKLLPQGEFKMLGLFFMLGIFFFFESLKSEGIYQGVSNGPGSIPQIISTAMLILIAGKAAALIRSGYKEGSFKETLEYLFNKEVVILLVMVMLYGLILETMHFITTSILFMFCAMYFLDRRQPIRKILISCAVVAVLVLIFAYIFQIILP